MGCARRLTDGDKRQLWARWKSGQPVVEIGQALGQPTPCLTTLLRKHGGIAPRDHKPRAGQLTPAGREEISRALSASRSAREIARNGGRTGYRATQAGQRALIAASRPKPCRLALSPRLRNCVAEKLSSRWSPQEIAGWLKTSYAADEDMRVAHETIYRSLFIQARGVLKRELLAALRSKKRMRRAHGAAKQAMKRSLIPDAISIRQRPPEAEDRAVPGHWEGDLITGSINSCIVTLVERRSRFLMLVKIGSRTSADVVEALARHIHNLPRDTFVSLTWDRGSEMTAHARFTIATGVKVYFCDPQSPWQRGSNENTNGLLRQYLPRGTDLSRFTQIELDAVAKQINTRPRQTLGFKTPAKVFNETVVSTG